MSTLAPTLPVLYTFTHERSYSTHSSSSPSVDSSSPVANQENDPIRSSTKPKKRVNFSLSPVTMNTTSPRTPKIAGAIHCKSILKSRPPLPNSSPSASSLAVSFGLETYPSFTAMLETMCAALEANDNHTKLDVYLNLNSALRGLKSYPDSGCLLNKITVLATYIRRDIEFPSDSLEGCESRVMIQALKFFTLLVSLDQVVHLIDPETISWILNLSISAIEDPYIKKNMLLCHLSFLASQRLTRLFNNELSNRVFDVLMRVHSRSKSIEGQCYQNFSTLVTMTPAVMLQRASEWVPLVLRASFSESSAMQSKAVLPLRVASRIFLGVKEFSRAVYEAFNMPVRPDKSPEVGKECIKTIFDECYENIEILLKNKHEEHILSVWETIVVLLIAWGRRRDERLDKWSYLNKWLDVFRKCVNSTDVAVRARAICAWQKLSYAWLTTAIIATDSDLSKRRTGILLTIFKFFQDNKPETMSALTSTFSKMVCLIMRPYVSTSQISASEFGLRQCEFTWNQLVVPVVHDNCLHNPSTFTIAATILHAMLATSSKTTPNRTEPELCFGTVSLNDIPKLNGKWTRARTELVLETIGKAFDKALTLQDRELAMQVWSAFLANIQSITKREVRQSPESMESIASICNYVQTYVKKSDMQPATFKFLILSIMETFGMTTLAEKTFACDENGNFIGTASPSSKTVLNNGEFTGSSVNLDSPFVRLWRAYITALQVSASNMPEYISALSSIVESVLTALSSRRKCISFLAVSLKANTLTRDPPVTSTAGKTLLSVSDKKARCWAVLAKCIMDLLYAADDFSQSSIVDEADIETELKNAVLSSAHQYAYDSDIAALAVSIFNKGNKGNVLDFIESFLRHIPEDKTMLATTFYATFTVMMTQLQAFVTYDCSDSTEISVTEQVSKTIHDLMQIVLKEVQHLTWSKEFVVDDSFYSAIISILQSINDSSFVSMVSAYYAEICCGQDTDSLIEKITESNQSVGSGYFLCVCLSVSANLVCSFSIFICLFVKQLSIEFSHRRRCCCLLRSDLSSYSI
ncbi:Rap1-interacting factor 1 N terminal-domain-containing protein [Lipomyces kononenkoae]|uniref:Rap1-interacting factor 1 N terminal-domain-containing protein n=1 Tax=Lipomyces kononenkoae TaxID=34357 RepID=A0ACC3TA46_LIPKO